jgi:hypothetical protein
VTAYGVKKAVENLPQLRDKLSTVCDNYLNVQQDILESFVDRGQLHKLTQPTILPSGKRIPGLKLDHPRQLALVHALVCFAHIAAGNSFTTAELYPLVLATLQMPAAQYSLASLRYDLRKLRAKDLVEKLPKSRRYRLRPQAIPFAWSSSNSSNAFTHRSLPAYSNLTGLTPNSRTTNEPTEIASIKRSQTISMRFFMLLASRLHEKRKQKSHQN